MIGGNPIQDGGCASKRPPTSFAPAASPKVGTNPHDILNFSFKLFLKLP